MRQAWKEAMDWLPARIALAVVLDLAIISFVLDVWSVIIR